ncbi:MAG: winged helix-turn-helix transcriptional regulator [Thermoleophilia bacterium]
MDGTGPRTCSVARTLEVVGERWALLVVREAFLGVHRFDEIRRNTGAPRDILSARLKSLVAAGVLERRQYQDRPVRHEYHLTAAGRDLYPVIVALRQWGDRHVHRDGPQPRRFLHECGGGDPASLICPDCGEAVEAGSYRPTAQAVG